jgi:hypothetical protein
MGSTLGDIEHLVRREPGERLPPARRFRSKIGRPFHHRK